MRITPAGAGKTVKSSVTTPPGADHPRVCGENLGLLSNKWRAWGITPAYAGKTHALKVGAGIGRDHPRVCGENFSRPQLLTSTAGSPPRMRGKRFTQNWEALRNRITPAYAGKTALAAPL